MKIGTSGQGGMADGMALFFFGIARMQRAQTRAERAKWLFSAILGLPLHFSWMKHKIYFL